MGIIDLLVTLLSPYLKALARPSTPEVLRTKECTQTLHFSIMFTLDSHLSLLRSLGVHHNQLFWNFQQTLKKLNIWNIFVTNNTCHKIWKFEYIYFKTKVVERIIGWIFFMVYDIDIHQLNLGQFKHLKFLDEISFKKCVFFAFV